ncbi:HTH domain-containing protein [Extibacter muris]|uniref:HTH domain-containing protein n=1 Tax=Extibacter muris TaxID=1796622 RepID=UPI001D0913B2|nr:HTH domain-containing protein [Extibacter muris]MCB6200819.1 helix-turn-helix domain-containing protein [Extibacter muris]MCQ4662150.1 helix-turn-helix domain-containing protein [Extibacter muris]MCQ4691937.1 helix-turn-helix domain-containing protein [Extibacter muris]
MENKTFMSVQEVADELGVSKSYAYKVVKQLNEELKKLGYLTVAGRVNAQYFHKKLCYSE